MKLTYTYPGDPPVDATLMFGREFKRDNPGREIRVGSGGEEDVVIPGEEAICDSCNTEVLDMDPCCVTLARLYCWGCFEKWVRPHAKIGG